VADFEQALRGSVARLLLLAAGLTLAGLAVPATGQALARSCPTPAEHAVDRSWAPLRFGIYPGGPAGSVSPKAPARAENPAKRLQAVRRLAGSGPFVVRLYSGWTGDIAADDVRGWLDDEIAGYSRAGLQVELVVRYKPAAAARSAPAAFARHVRGLVRRYGRNRRFVSLQVANEANLPNAPEAADGAFAYAARALVKGVIAAKRRARRDGRRQLSVGFSWAYDERPQASGKFWRTLGRLGGRRFAKAVDWVGLDSYPGTWEPQIALSRALPARAARAVKESVRWLRDCLMPLAGLGPRKALHIAENGFPTGPERSEQLQARVLAAMVRGVGEISASYGVTDFRWFDLRDSSTSDSSIESRYGITRDDYSRKPAFATYRDLVARYGGRRAPLARDARCRPSRAQLSLAHKKPGRLTSLVAQIARAYGIC